MSVNIAYIIPIVAFSVGVLVGMIVMCLLAVLKERGASQHGKKLRSLNMTFAAFSVRSMTILRTQDGTVPKAACTNLDRSTLA